MSTEFRGHPSVHLVEKTLKSVCLEPAISHDSHHVSLVQWTNLLADFSSVNVREYLEL
jgi:hypothetical protein